MKSAVGSTGLHPRTTAYCNSDGRFAQIASWQYCSMAWLTLLDCRLRELRRNHCATAGQAQTRTYPGQRSSTGSCVPYRFRLGGNGRDAQRNGTERITEEIIATCNYVPPSARKQRSVSG